MIFNPLPGIVGTHFRKTQGFGENIQRYKALYGLLGHNGYDLAPLVAGMRGVVLYAPHEGYVRTANEGIYGYGLYMEIISEPYSRDGLRRKSVLAHLARCSVLSGSFVYALQPIAIMGGEPGMRGAGDSTGIHVHFDYKTLDREGRTLNADNGRHGAIDIGPYIQQWYPNGTLIHS